MSLHLTTVRLGGRPDLPLLLLGPAPGSGVTAQWGPAGRLLGAELQVVGWELPGQGHAPALADDEPEPTVRDLAEALLDVVERLDHGGSGSGLEATRFHLAGVSVGGDVAREVRRLAPERALSTTVVESTTDVSPEDLAERVRAAALGGHPGTEPGAEPLPGPGLDTRTRAVVDLAAAAAVGHGVEAAVAAARAAGWPADEVAEVLVRAGGGQPTGT